MLRQRPAAAVVFLIACAGPPALGAEAPLADTLRRAGAYVAEYRDRLALLCASERLVQNVWMRNVRNRTSYLSQSDRVLVSDVLWVPTGDALVAAFYRDVWTVDGVQVRNRGERLLELFPGGPSAVGREQAQAILEESASHNLGTMQRTTNFPTLAISFLHPINQPRFSFREKGETRLGGRRAVEIGYREVRHPTLTASVSGEDMEAHGTFWVAPDDGAVLKTELRYSSADAGIDVKYALDPNVGFWVPQEMVESYGEMASSERFKATATYSDYRRGNVEVGPIRYK